MQKLFGSKSPTTPTLKLESEGEKDTNEQPESPPSPSLKKTHGRSISFFGSKDKEKEKDSDIPESPKPRHARSISTLGIGAAGVGAAFGRPGLRVDNGPQYQTLTPTFAALDRLFRTWDVVVLVDDSVAMKGDCWKETRKALSDLAPSIARFSTAGSEGVEIQFVTNPSRLSGLRAASGFKAIFSSVQPTYPALPLGKRLQGLLNAYIEDLERAEVQARVRPVYYLVILSQKPTDPPHAPLSDIILNAAMQLDSMEASEKQIHVHLVQVGLDAELSEYLEDFCDSLKDRGEDDARNITSTYPASHAKSARLDLGRAITLGRWNKGSSGKSRPKQSPTPLEWRPPLGVGDIFL